MYSIKYYIFPTHSIVIRLELFKTKYKSVVWVSKTLSFNCMYSKTVFLWVCVCVCNKSEREFSKAGWSI